jgi:hypothetical protein
VLNISDFYPQFVAPGTNGVPPAKPVTFFEGYSPPLAVPEGSLGIIQHTTGSSRRPPPHTASSLTDE